MALKAGDKGWVWHWNSELTAGQLFALNEPAAFTHEPTRHKLFMRKLLACAPEACPVWKAWGVTSGHEGAFSRIQNQAIPKNFTLVVPKGLLDFPKDSTFTATAEPFNALAMTSEGLQNLLRMNPVCAGGWANTDHGKLAAKLQDMLNQGQNVASLDDFNTLYKKLPPPAPILNLYELKPPQGYETWGLDNLQAKAKTILSQPAQQDPASGGWGVQIDPPDPEGAREIQEAAQKEAAERAAKRAEMADRQGAYERDRGGDQGSGFADIARRPSLVDTADLADDPVSGDQDKDETDSGGSGWLWAGVALLIAAPIGYMYAKKRGLI